MIKCVSIGCKVNQAEMRELDSRLRGNDNIVVLNTCAVTATAEAKSRKLIRRLIRENPGSRLIVTGCLVQAKPDEVKKLLRKEDLVVGNKEKGGIGEIIANSKLGMAHLGIHNPQSTPRTRAFVKIQDGCNNFCSYCIVPFLRSEMWSKPPNTVDRDISKLIDNGYKEIVLTGINLGKHKNLIGVLGRLVKIDGLKRLRLSSIELEDVSNELIELMSNNKVICPHLHIPLQSGSDRILKLMKRHYTSGDFIKRIEYIKSRVKLPAVTTDVIVGFPGESDDDFRQTLAVCRAVGFSKIHIFPFSPRQGTAAFRLKDKVAIDTIKNRFKTLNNLARELSLRYKQLFLNKEVDILIEDSAEGFTDRYIKVKIKPGGKTKSNQIVKVRVTGIKPDYVAGIATKSLPK